MNKAILIIHMKSRSKSAVNVQKILTKYGCIIKTRLGIHDGVLAGCTDNGLIILEVVGDKLQRKRLNSELKILKEVKTKLIELPFD